MKIPSTFLFLALTVTANAQTEPAAQTGIDAGTFGMAKATLEFLATDQKTFGAAKKPACDGCTDYVDLTEFIKTNNLKKADGLVNDIKKHSMMLNDEFAADAFTSEGAVLDSLRRYVMKRVTNGPERVHRTKLASFAAYETKMTALAGGADPEKAVNEQEAALLEGDTPADGTATASTGMDWGKWAFWLSLLNLAGLVYLVLTRQRGAGGPVISDKDDARLAGLQDENNRLSSTVAELANRLTIAEKKLAGAPPAGPANRPVERTPAATQPIADRGPAERGMMPQAEPPRRPDAPAERPMGSPAPVGNQPRTGYGNPANPVIPPQNAPMGNGSAGAQQASAFPSQSQGAPLRTTPIIPPAPSAPGTPVGSVDQSGTFGTATPTPPPPPAPAPTKLFARTADLGNGFSVAGLLELAERGTVYEIDLTSPNTATFQVSQSPESQQLAMSDPYSYLSDACLYENQPGGPNSRIQTVAPGQLTLQGDKWQITDKARIGFV
ncbi:hypothetical protein [Fibrivirga algicola]|uniref:Uncharacterized protein n=1 Tax=Fibrivirga algicola TaxID=2950420 RepID=A0ABX0QHZ8_9BACT|nr:hypothetical protein [Fibrivirga algicola]NID10483.1 hypothetical protein [Fibrivirga algicola]